MKSAVGNVASGSILGENPTTSTTSITVTSHEGTLLLLHIALLTRHARATYCGAEPTFDRREGSTPGTFYKRENGRKKIEASHAGPALELMLRRA